jgi:phosphoribosylformylglycinamidine synthase
MNIGLAKKNKVFYSIASGVGNPVIYVGSKTGRDGIHGASMASQEFDSDSESKKPTVQVGDPFAEKLLLEACLELMQTDTIVSIQDMGAAGLTSSSVEMASKGNIGIELNLNKVPCRETGMTPYEMMLSESQERMLIVLKNGKEKEAEKIFKKWDLDFSVIGILTDSKNLTLKFDSKTVCDIPISALADEAPKYKRDWVEIKKPEHIDIEKKLDDINIEQIIKRLLSHPNQADKSWVWEQYDHMVMCDTAQVPGGDAAVIRVHGNNKKAIAATVDCTPRYCNAHPYTGGMQAVCETYRNLCAVGAEPIAITNCLNFGNPEKPEIMGQFVGVIKGMAEACNKLNYPVISGNVSLYNETNGVGINPTPTIGGVGLVKDISKVKSFKFKNKNSDIYVLGRTKGHLEQSVLCYDLLHLKKGPPPPIDLNIELKNGKAVKSLIDKDLIDACHDVSSGGIILCLLEMSIASNIGFNLKTHKKALDRVKYLFGEDQSRYIVEVNEQNKQSFENYLKDKDIFFKNIGKTSEKIFIDDDLKFDLKELSEINKQWFYKYNN